VRRGVLGVLLSVLLLASTAALVYWDFSAYIETPVEAGPDRQVKVVVPQGSTLSHVVSLLEEQGLVASPNYFRLYLVLKDEADKLKAGVYYFSVKETPADLAADLVRGPRIPFNVVTIKEGFNIWQVARAFEQGGIATADEVLDLASDEQFVAQLGIPLPKNADVLSPLEGFVFPETYYVAPGQTLRSILTRMVQQTFKELRAAKKRNIEAYARVMEETGFTDFELVTLASIIERETALQNEKKLVASVFLNRIKRGWLLQTDPTLTYTVEKKGSKPEAADRQNRNNRYNTYQYIGLPPGPICNPGRETFDAVVAPSKTRFLYFVAKGDGSGGHFFSTNLADHDAAVKKYLAPKPENAKMQ